MATDLCYCVLQMQVSSSSCYSTKRTKKRTDEKEARTRETIPQSPLGLGNLANKIRAIDRVALAHLQPRNLAIVWSRDDHFLFVE